MSIPEETDRVDRTFVVRNDGKKGDLSRFVDEALRGRVLDLAARRVKDRNVGYDERRFSILIGEEVDATRGGRSSHQHPRRRPHHKGGSAGPAQQQFTLAGSQEQIRSPFGTCWWKDAPSFATTC